MSGRPDTASQHEGAPRDMAAASAALAGQYHPAPVSLL